MTNQPMIESLKVALADSFSLYLKTLNYHWNVEGPHFKTIHELLESQYEDLAGAIDELAEHIRMLGDKAPGTSKAFAKITNIEDGDEHADANTMLKHLIEDQKTIIKTLTQGIKQAQAVEDEVITGALTDRIHVHRKNLWMLSVTIK
jgi:starvation-inducible DNA-binding protein